MASVLNFLLGATALIWVFAVVSPQVYRPLMLLLGVLAIFATKRTPGRAGRIIDAAWIVAAFAGLSWPLLQGDALMYRAVTPTTMDVAAGMIAILVVLEATRRTTGWILPISAVVFLAYALAGPWLGTIGLGGLAHRGYDLPRLVGSLGMTLEGMYGLPLDVAVTYIILFSLYGAMLEHSGAGRYFLDFSMRWSGRGSPAVSAGRSVTLAGFLLGTVSGSGVATTVTLGSVAWPVLRRVGFKADTAGAMLAASGIGALLSPPTLGAAAFLIAEYLRISYLQVLVMATLPTVLYYLSILLMIEADARSGTGVSGLPNLPGLLDPPGLPSSPGHLDPPGHRGSYHFLSLVLVAVLMASGMTAFRAVVWAAFAAVVLSFLGRRDEQLRPRSLVRAIASGGDDVLPVIGTTAVAGVIVGVITLTGLGLKAAGVIVGMAHGSLVLTVIFAAVAVWILGLAVPVTASYIISAVMVVPALTAVGVAPVAAHMFIFYYAVLSEVSPPTALAPFAAAALTGGSPFRTMILTWKYSLPAFLVPFAFTLDPRGLGLLLQADWWSTIVSTGTAAAGVAALAFAFGGRAWQRASIVERILAGAGGVLLVYPAPAADVIGLAAAGIALVLNARARKVSVMVSPTPEGE